MDNDKKTAGNGQMDGGGQESGPGGLMPRRKFLSQGIAAAGSLMIGSGLGAGALAKDGAKSVIDAAVLSSQYGFKGKALLPSDPDFARVAFGELWNELRPKRAPQLILQVADEQDVVAAIKFAEANKLKVAVRGGGHNWCCPSLRNSGVMIDLANLNQVISIDPQARKAVVQPIISNREIQEHLNAQGLSYPSGHCPPVKLSGYLLSGGMSWNQGVWGPGVGSIEAIEMVTAAGKQIVASADQNQDYFWAARGAGPGLFAVATRYHLKLYPLPKAIAASVYYYPYENLAEVAAWLGPIASQLPNFVELSLFILQAPPELAEQARGSSGKVCMVVATIFAETPQEAKSAVAPLDTCPILDKCLKKIVAEPTTFPDLFDASGALWPGNLRCRVDALFSNSPVENLFQSVQEHFLKASPKTVVMFALFTGPNVPAPLMDTAFSMSAKMYGGTWTMWDKASDDAENIKWHEKCIELLRPHIAGHYVSETDTVDHPGYAKASYKEANWKRLEELRKKYDPEGVFFGYFDGLS